MSALDDLFNSDSDDDDDVIAPPAAEPAKSSSSSSSTAAASRGDDDDDDESDLSSDSDNDDDDDDEEEGRGKLKLTLKKTGGKKASRSSSSSSSSSSKGGGKRKAAQPKQGGGAKRSRGVNMANFIEEEVEVEDDEEEEEDGVMNSRMRREMEEAREADRAYKQVQRQREARGNQFNEGSVQDIANALEERYKAQAEIAQARGGTYGRAGGAGEIDDYDDDLAGGAGGALGDAGRNANLPKVDDPQLFAVPCKGGEERKIVVQLMNKWRAMVRKGTPPGVLSVTHSSTKSFIYVEAKREAYIAPFLRGIRGIYGFKAKKVPILEMPTCLTIMHRSKALKVGSYVRCKRGLFKGDLAKVIDLTDAGGKATVQMVPRIDLSTLNLSAAEAKKRAQQYRPPQRFFTRDEITSRGVEYEERRFGSTSDDLMYLRGEYYDPSGFCVKEVATNALNHTEVKPTIEELRMFRERRDAFGGGRRGGDDDDEDPDGLRNRDDDPAAGDGMMDALADDRTIASLTGGSSSETQLVKGDTVRVIAGDLLHLLGKVTAIDVAANTVRVDPLVAELAGQILEIPAKQLIKFFNVGTHVKVVNGRYTGETGNIVSVGQEHSQYVAVVFLDQGSREIKVRLNDLQESAEQASGLDSLGGYELFDLVYLQGMKAGVVVHVGRENLKVLLQTDKATTFTLADIVSKRSQAPAANRMVALDSKMRTVASNTMVKVVNGPHKGVEGTVRYIHKSTLFVHSNFHHENGGIFAVNPRMTLVCGTSLARSSQPTGGRGGAGAGSMGPPAGGAGGKGGKGGKGGRFQDELVGRRVRIKRGMNKGMTGVVSRTTADHAFVELDSRMKTVRFSRSDIFDLTPGANGADGLGGVGGGLGAGMAGAGAFGAMAGGGAGGALDVTSTPFAGAATPLNAPATPFNPMTPMAPGTPGRDAPGTPGGADPSWDAAIGNTPMHDMNEWEETRDSELPGGAGGAGGAAATTSQTPAIDATPMGTVDGSTPGWGTTPGSMAGGATPGSVGGATPGGATPGAGGGGGGQSKLDWAMRFVVVKLLTDQEPYRGATGFIDR